MENWNNVFFDYYVNKLNSSKMIERYPFLSSDKIYHGFPKYIHDSICCEFCHSKMESKFVSKSASLSGAEFIENVTALEVLEFSEASVHYQSNYDGFRLASNGKAIKTKEGYLIDFPCCSCGHSPAKNCDCEACIEVKKVNKYSALRLLSKEFMADIENVKSIRAMTAKEIFNVLCAITYYQNKDFISIYEMNDASKKSLLSSGFFYVDEISLEGALHMRSVCEYIVDRRKLKFLFKCSECQDLDEAVVLLKKTIYKNISDVDFKVDILDLWRELALAEAQDVLAHYSGLYGFKYDPTEQILSAITRSLSRYGLALTARYIYNSVKYNDHKGKERGLNRKHSFNLIGSSMSYWVDNPESKKYESKPFHRGHDVLIEPKSVIVFSHSFLETQGINYFSDPISMQTIQNVR